MKFNWEKSNRTLEVTELPGRVAGLVSADELTVSVDYTDGPSCRKGITLDNAVLPLMAAAPELLEALKILRAQIGDYRDGQGAAKFHACNIADAAIAKAEGKPDAIAFRKPIA
jgi:hypothetical protein